MRKRVTQRADGAGLLARLRQESLSDRDPAALLIEQAEEVLRARLANTPNDELAAMIVALNAVRRVLNRPQRSSAKQYLRGLPEADVRDLLRLPDADVRSFLSQVEAAARRFLRKDKLIAEPLQKGRAKDAKLDFVLEHCNRMLLQGHVEKRVRIEQAGRFALRFLHGAEPTKTPAGPQPGSAAEEEFLHSLTVEAEAGQRPLTAKRILMRAARHLGRRRPDNLFARRHS